MCATAQALRQADELYAEFKPHLADMIDNNDPSVVGLTFSDIEANSAAVGDLVAKLMMLRALAAQPPATDEEIAAIRQKARKSAGPARAAQKTAPELNMTRQRGKRRRIKTVRGEITFERGYLHFPELGTGLFPPRGTTED
jgi:hypothetical protein